MWKCFYRLATKTCVHVFHQEQEYLSKGEVLASSSMLTEIKTKGMSLKLNENVHPSVTRGLRCVG